MNLTKHICTSMLVSGPPRGAVNVIIGNAVEGPGGRWIPCASVNAFGLYVSCVYEVGPNRRQVCECTRQTSCPHDALARATELATIAAA